MEKPGIQKKTTGSSEEETKFIVPEELKGKLQPLIETEQADRMMQIYRQIDGQTVVAADNWGVRQTGEVKLDIDEGSEEYYRCYEEDIRAGIPQHCETYG